MMVIELFYRMKRMNNLHCLFFFFNDLLKDRKAHLIPSKKKKDTKPIPISTEIKNINHSNTNNKTKNPIISFNTLSFCKMQIFFLLLYCKIFSYSTLLYYNLLGFFHVSKNHRKSHLWHEHIFWCIILNSHD